MVAFVGLLSGSVCVHSITKSVRVRKTN